MIVVTADCDVAKILKNHNLADKNKARRYLAGFIRNHADKYTPYQSGILKDTAYVTQDGRFLIYNGPYAHYQYHGKAMGPNLLTKDGWRALVPKGGRYYTGKDLKYHDAPLRKSHWIDYTMATHGNDIRADLAAYLNNGGNP